MAEEQDATRAIVIDTVALANDLLKKFGSPPAIKEISDCNHVFFKKIYEAMLGENLPGLNISPETLEDEIHNVQVVIDSLATDVLGIDLSHIDAQSVVNKEAVHIQNLLEIFDGLLDYVIEELNDEDDKSINNHGQVDDLEDSNLICNDHEVISDVFQEEFGSSIQENRENKAFQKEVIPPHTSVLTDSHQFMWSKDDHLEKQKNEIKTQKANTENLKTIERNDKTSSPSNSEDYWSSILHQTSSAVESMTALKEIGQRPRNKFPVERKRRQKKETSTKRHINVHHKHMHHHHHYQDDTTASSTATSSTTTSTQSTPVKSLRSKDLRSTEIQTHQLDLIDSAVQTENNTENFTKNGSYEEKLKKSIDANKKFLKENQGEGSKETRYQQLADLSARLQSLRQGLTTSTCAADNADVEENTGKTEKQKANKETSSKLQPKVSFATETREREFYSSDTEIDYGSPYRRIEENSRRSILKAAMYNSKNTTSSTSDSDDYDTARHALPTTASNKSISSRFEKPYLQRDERLFDMGKAFKMERLENENMINKLNNKYAKQHSVLLNRQKDVKKQSNILNKENRKVKAPSYDTVVKKTKERRPKKDGVNSRTASIYRKSRSSRRDEKVRPRKRSASASPVGRRHRKTPMLIAEDEILPIMEEEFPFLYLSPRSAKLMWQKQMRQAEIVRKVAVPHSKSKAQQKLEEAERKQQLLTKIMKKELEHNKRLKDYKEHKDSETLVKRKLNEKRQRSARARRYYADYVIQNKARMLKKKSKEEKEKDTLQDVDVKNQIFKRLFEDGLEIQKQRIHEMRQYAREKKEKNAQKQQDQIDSLENYYRGQFSMLAEAVTQERQGIEVRQKAQKQVLNRMRTEMRRRMEHDIQEIQKQLQDEDEDDGPYFRQLDADNLKREFQLATYRASQLKR